MKTQLRDWITLHEASEAVKVSANTIRDWYVSGAIESKVPVGGTRMVRLLQVQEQATRARTSQLPISAYLLPEGAARDSESPEAAARLAAAILDLQSIARDRLAVSSSQA